MLSLLAIFGVTLAAFLLVIAAMAVGVMMGRRQISGSCGGLANQTDAEGKTSCSLCSDPDAACHELANRMRSPTENGPAQKVSPSPVSDCQLDCEAEGCSKEKIDSCKGH